MRAMVLPILVLLTGPVAADEVIPGPIPATVLRVIDGDTVSVRARVWLGQDIETSVRIAGIDTPELYRPGCEDEARLAAAARDRLVELLGDGPVWLHDIAYGTYAGRVVARVESASGTDVAEPLLSAGLARAYDGRQARAPWCP